MITSKSLKFFIIGAAVLLAASIYIYVTGSFSQIDQRNIRLEELLALSALAFLYLSVLPNPLKRIFPNSSAIQIFHDAQPTLAYATLGFAIIHAAIAFFFLLGGFAGLSFLSAKFLWGISLSSLALTTLLLISIYNWTSRRYRWVSNLLYIVGVLITVHALLLGADFIQLTNLIPKIFFTALITLLVLEAWALDVYLYGKEPESKKFSPIFALCLVFITIFGYYLLSPQAQTLSVSEHAGHIMPDGSLMPGMVMTGDTSLKYNVTMSSSPTHPLPGQDVTLTFKVFNAATGEPISDYDIVMTKVMHLVMVDGSLTFFDHIHPELKGTELTVTTKFPKDDLYRLYLNFQPKGGAEQQVAMSLPVGTGISTVATLPASENTKPFNGMKVSIASGDGSPFSASKMNAATQSLNFNFKDAGSGEPVSDLRPYLGAFGHLVLINEKTYEYIHVHPANTLAVDFSGPDVQFYPSPMFGKITPGTYRMFGQFNHNNSIFVTDFTINIQ